MISKYSRGKKDNWKKGSKITLIVIVMVCSMFSIHNCHADMVPLIIEISNQSLKCPSVDVVLYIDEIEVFRGTILAKDQHKVKRIEQKVSKGDRHLIHIVSKGSRIGSSLGLAVDKTVYVYIAYGFDAKERIPLFSFYLSEEYFGID